MDSREGLLTLLADYRRRHSAEASEIDTLEGFVRAHSDCFERRLSIGHVTGSAWLVDKAGERVLLTHHKKLQRWLQLGGHADGEADILAVALREAQEESGLTSIETLDGRVFDIDIHAIPARGDEAEHLHYDLRFAFRASGDQQFRVSDESNELAWVDIASMGNWVQDPSMLRMADKWLRAAGAAAARV